MKLTRRNGGVKSRVTPLRSRVRVPRQCSITPATIASVSAIMSV